MTPKNAKPLGVPAYGSIPHLPGSRTGPSDHTITEGQLAILTTRCRDRHDTIIVQEKLDGSCTAVAKINGEIVPLGRAGYRADTSPYAMHQHFHNWVMYREQMFQSILSDGERLVGEWLSVAHGTRYIVDGNEELWRPFDLFKIGVRQPLANLLSRINGTRLRAPHTLFFANEPCSLRLATDLLLTSCRTAELDTDIDANATHEGVVYRCERFGRVDFLAKYVFAEKVDGLYLSSMTGGEDVLNRVRTA